MTYSSLLRTGVSPPEEKLPLQNHLLQTDDSYAEYKHLIYEYISKRRKLDSVSESVFHIERAMEKNPGGVLMPAKIRVHIKLLKQEEDAGKEVALLQKDLIQRQSRIKLDIQD